MMDCSISASMIAKDLLFSCNKQEEKPCWKSLALLTIMHTQTYLNRVLTTAAQKGL